MPTTPQLLRIRAGTTLVNMDQIRTRAAAAALYDMGHGGKRRRGPYTIGTVEHDEWTRTYNAAFQDRATADSTPGRPADLRHH